MTYETLTSIADWQLPIVDTITPSWEPDSPEGRLVQGGTVTPRLSRDELRDFSDSEGAFWRGLIIPVKHDQLPSTGVEMAWPGPLSAAQGRFDHDGDGRYSAHSHIDMAGIIHQQIRSISIDEDNPTVARAIIIDDILTDTKIFLDWRIEILDQLSYDVDEWNNTMMDLAQDLLSYTHALRNRINKWRGYNSSFVI